MSLRFGEFVFDAEARQLLRGREPVHLGPKAFDLLELLLRNRPRALPRARIRRHVWADRVVGEGSLGVLVAELRSALGDNGREPRFVRTVFGFGYAFSGTVEDDARPGTREGPDLRQPRVIWERKVIPLLPGDNVLGRGEDATVRIDAPGISRRHARIRVEGELVTLEDLDSKNGTFLGDARLTGAAQIVDGSVVRLGWERLVYRESPDWGSTLTHPAG